MVAERAKVGVQRLMARINGDRQPTQASP